RRPPAAVPELPRRPGRDGTVAGRSRDQPAVDRRHHRGVRVRPDRTGGDAMTNRIAVNPIPYWSKAGKTREVFDEAFRDFQQIGFTAVKADVPDDMSATEYAGWIGGY